MNITFNGRIHELKDLREFICKVFGCAPPQHKPKDRLFVLEVEGVDEPITKGSMRVKLSKPIRPGFQRPITLTPDEPVDAREDGTFAGVEPVEGDSSLIIRPESSAKSIKAFVRGDGTLGTGKVARVVADGHVGDGEAQISLEIEWDVMSPDATEFNPAVEEGVDEPIPV